MKILICEPEAGGHHFRYVEAIAAQALERGHTPILATTAKAEAHPAFREICKRIASERMPVVRLDDPTLSFLPRFSRAQQVFRQWLTWLSFRKCYRAIQEEYRPDFVLVPYFDDMEITVALAGSPFGATPWGGIVMRNRFHQSTVNPYTPKAKFSSIRRWIFERNLHSTSLGALVTIDETLVHSYSREERPESLHFVPEPADLLFTIAKEEARRRLGIPEDGHYILLYGSIHLRKGLLEAIGAVRSLPQELNPRLLIVGPQDFAGKKIIADYAQDLRSNGRLFEFDRFASQEDESLAFSAADIVWVAYSRHYIPSSVQGKACRAGHPIIACREGNLGWTTLRYGLGRTVDVQDPTAVQEALIDMIQSHQSNLATYRENGTRYTTHRTAQEFGNAIVELAEQTLSQRGLAELTSA